MSQPTRTASIMWEHSHREFLPNLRLMRRLMERDVTPSLSPLKRGGVREATSPDVVTIPFYYDPVDLETYLYGHRGRPTSFINLSYEQMHFACGRGYILPDGEFAQRHMLHCAWGPRYFNHLVRHGVPAENIRVTGHPRFDLYAKDTLSEAMALSREELAGAFGLDPHKPWLLIPYNFNMAYLTPKQVQALVSRRYALTPEFIEGFARAKDRFTAFNDALCGALDGVEVILRVHPAGYESEEIYRALSARRPNLHLISAWDISHWIKQAAGVMVWNSTTAMEALVAGVPVFSFEPEPLSERFDYDLNRIITTVRAERDALDLISALARGDAARVARDLEPNWELFEEWYQYRDGQSDQRLAAVVVEAAEGGAEIPWRRYTSPLKTTRAWWRARKRLQRLTLLDRVSGESSRELARTLDLTPLRDLLR
ncbi:MAG: hypothetical protein FJ138_05645 [Deltaproteobacteria bacterium]|nr:hypothetical protein [Deltaproteobacteria bacterium]